MTGHDIFRIGDMATLSKTHLLEQIKTTLTKTKADKLTAILHDKEFAVIDLIDLTFYPDKKTAFRAAWLLENLLLLKPRAYTNQLDYLLGSFPLVKNYSCMRHYVKIAMHLTSPRADANIRAKLSETNLEPLVDTCFGWLIDRQIPVAIKVFAAQTLYNLKDRYTWIGGELKEQLIFLMRDGSAAIQSRGKKLLVKL